MKHTALVAFVLMLTSACNGGRTDSATADPTHTASRCNLNSEHSWCDTSLSPAQRAEELVAAMSLAQKIDYLAGDAPAAPASCDPYCGVINGIEELDIPPLRMSDGPLGARGSAATALPIPLALAASFNPGLAYATGALVGNEVRHKGNDLLHAPVADLIRNPLAGRTFETFGEDPLLATRLTVPWIRGVQDQGVMANLKHYVGNTQEGVLGVPPLVAVVGGRNLVNMVVDQRTLRETYLPPYEAGVREADVASLMCAYNLVNGEPACSSPQLLQQLTAEWGFDGFIVTDYYFAQKDTVNTANTAATLEMPYALFYQPALLQASIASGAVSEQTLDEHLRTVMRTLFRFGFFDRPAYERDDEAIDQMAHADTAREIAEQGAVLLRNQGALPLSPTVQHIAVIGLSANERPSGGGSSFVTPFQFTSPLDGIRARAGDALQVSYSDGRDADAAATLASQANVAIVFANSLATEGVDKFCLALDCTLADVPDSLLLNQLPAGSDSLNLVLDPILGLSPVSQILEQAFAPLLLGGQPLPVQHRQQDELIAAVAAANSQTVVVLQTGGPVLTPWRDAVNAILEIWYPGQEAGDAVARLLFGDSDPGGRLPVSFPAAESDTPVAGEPTRYPGLANQAQHSEGIFIGYRWFDENNIEPAYPFGFGLSYSQFELSDLQLESDAESFISARITVTNTGDRAGWAVPQLYLGLPDPSAAVLQPPAALKDFSKLYLQAGQSQTIELNVDARGLSYWDATTASWQIAAGCYQIMLGQSSRDIAINTQLAVGGGQCANTRNP